MGRKGKKEWVQKGRKNGYKRKEGRIAKKSNDEVPHPFKLFFLYGTCFGIGSRREERKERGKEIL